MPEQGERPAGFLEPFARGEEELFKVIRLALVHDIEHVGGVQVLRAVEEGGEVGRRIVGRTIGFPDDEGLGLEARVLRMKDDLRPFAFRGQATTGQLAVDRLQLVVVETLAEGEVEPDAELLVDVVEGGQTDFADVPPERQILRVVGLQPDEFLLRLLEHGRVGFGRGIPEFVKALEFLQGAAGEGRGIEVAFIGPDEFAKLGPPVADMIVPDDLRSAELQQPADGLADHG